LVGLHQLELVAVRIFLTRDFFLIIIVAAW